MVMLIFSFSYLLVRSSGWNRINLFSACHKKQLKEVRGRREASSYLGPEDALRIYNGNLTLRKRHVEEE